MHWVYILKCGDGSLYTGWTTDLPARIRAHDTGTGAKYTKGRGPVELVFAESWAAKGDALRREAAIKKMSREAKLEMISKKNDGAL